MADIQTERDLRSIRRSLEAQGIEGNVDVKVSEKRQWYRADGSALPNLLPDDDYHRARFQAKGWTLVAPNILIDQDKAPEGLCPIEQEVAKSGEAAKEKERQLGVAEASETPFLDADDTTTAKENE